VADDTIIGLPANLFYSTGIPVCVLVLKRPIKTVVSTHHALFFKFAAGSGKKAGEFYTPQRISDILSAPPAGRGRGTMRSMVEGGWVPESNEKTGRDSARYAKQRRLCPLRLASTSPAERGRSRRPARYSAASFTRAGSGSVPVQGCSATSNSTPSGPYSLTSKPPTRSALDWSM
jgi:hypothetical protein